MGDTREALKIPGVELVAVCDIYDGRLDPRHEVYGAPALHDTRLSRSARPERYRRGDHRHTRSLAHATSRSPRWKRVRMSIARSRWCSDRRRQTVIAAQERTGRIFQVGSQYVTSASTRKPKTFCSPALSAS